MSEPICDIRQIMNMLPHRYPFLLVDRVLEFEAGKRVLACKNVTYDEPFFQGHFPGRPIMPGVLILEALAQAGGLCIIKGQEEVAAQKLFLFTGIDKVKFRKTVTPGDRIMLEAVVLRHKMSIWKMQGKATVDGAVVAEGLFSAAILDKEKME